MIIKFQMLVVSLMLISFLSEVESVSHRCFGDMYLCWGELYQFYLLLVVFCMTF